MSFKQLCEQCTPGELKVSPRGSKAVTADNCWVAACDEGFLPNEQKPFNTKRIVLSWNHFPQAVELLERLLSHGRFKLVSPESANAADDAVRFLQTLNTAAASGKGEK